MRYSLNWFGTYMNVISYIVNIIKAILRARLRFFGPWAKECYGITICQIILTLGFITSLHATRGYGAYVLVPHLFPLPGNINMYDWAADVNVFNKMI